MLGRVREASRLEMKNAKFVPCNNKKQAFVREFDVREINNEDKYDFFHLHYLERIGKVMQVAERYCSGKKILDLGSAQSNISLLLAEKGFITTGLDINVEFLKYSRAKHETGRITWVCANAMDLPFQKESLDGVIVAELLEHCAYPEKIVEEACACLKPRGFLAITTPNADCVVNKETRFSKMKIDRISLEERQFGPAGENHLFTLSANEVVSMLPNNLKILGILLLEFNLIKWSYIRVLPICTHKFA